MFLFDFIIFSELGRAWKWFLSQPIMSHVAIFLFSLVMLVDHKLNWELPEPFYPPIVVLIFMIAMGILFISSTIALIKKKGREWNPKNWV